MLYYVKVSIIRIYYCADGTNRASHPKGYGLCGNLLITAYLGPEGPFGAVGARGLTLAVN